MLTSSRRASFLRQRGRRRARLARPRSGGPPKGRSHGKKNAGRNNGSSHQPTNPSGGPRNTSGGRGSSQGRRGRGGNHNGGAGGGGNGGSRRGSRSGGNTSSRQGSGDSNGNANDNNTPHTTASQHSDVQTPPSNDGPSDSAQADGSDSSSNGSASSTGSNSSIWEREIRFSRASGVNSVSAATSRSTPQTTPHSARVAATGPFFVHQSIGSTDSTEPRLLEVELRQRQQYTDALQSLASVLKYAPAELCAGLVAVFQAQFGAAMTPSVSSSTAGSSF